MVEGIGLHRLDDGDIVHHLGEMRQQLAQLRPALAMAAELVLRRHERAVGVDEGRPIALEQLGWRQLAIPFHQFGLVIEQFEMARRAGLEEVDHALRLGGEVGELGRQGVHQAVAAEGAGPDHVLEQRAQRDRAQSHAALAEEPAPGGLGA
jgi:hypothetical protein